VDCAAPVELPPASPSGGAGAAQAAVRSSAGRGRHADS